MDRGDQRREAGGSEREEGDRDGASCSYPRLSRPGSAKRSGLRGRRSGALGRQRYLVMGDRVSRGARTLPVVFSGFYAKTIIYVELVAQWLWARLGGRGHEKVPLSEKMVGKWDTPR